MDHCIRHTVLLASFALELLGAQTVAAAQTAEETWQVIYVGAQRVGYSRTTTSIVTRDHRKIIHTKNEDHMKIKRFGEPLSMQITLSTKETEQGDMLSFLMEVHNPPASTTRTRGRVDGNRLRLETTIDGRVQKRTIEWEPGTKSPAYQDRQFRIAVMKPGQTRSFKTFEPAFNKVTSVKITADDFRPVRLLDGKEHRLLKVRIVQSILPEVTLRAYLDEKGEARKIDLGLLGMVAYTVPEAVALEAIAGAELDLAVKTLVPVTRIRNAHQTKRLVYRITTPGTDPSKYLVDGGTQQVKKTGPETAELTVTAVKPTDSVISVRAKPEYLAATRFLQCRDARIVEHARRAAAGETRPARIALRMERYVHEKLTKKDFSTALASAAEVARKLEGDCTEHAVLLAAMLRAQKIPSRIAVGLVYIEGRSQFGGHMWTEAFLGGRWIPLDATLGRGGIGAAHIKLAESSFADDAPSPMLTFVPLLEVLGKMKIEVLASE